MSHPTFSSYKITARQNMAVGWAAFALKLPNQKIPSDKCASSSLQTIWEGVLSPLCCLCCPLAPVHDLHPQGQDVPPPEIKPLGHRVLLLLFSATLPPQALPAVQKPMGGVTMTLNPCVFEGTSQTDRFGFHGTCQATQVNLTWLKISSKHP